MNQDVKIINRVPHIITLYWIIKIASTTLGETSADMFSMTFNLGYGATILIFMAVFLLPRLLYPTVNYQSFHRVISFLI